MATVSLGRKEEEREEGEGADRWDLPRSERERGERGGLDCVGGIGRGEEKKTGQKTGFRPKSRI